MGNISIVHDDPVVEQCGYCDNGIQCDHYCRHCGGDGIDVLDLSALATLAHNLAVAGAMMAAALYAELRLTQGIEWMPGCGVEAPGWNRRST